MDSLLHRKKERKFLSVPPLSEVIGVLYGTALRVFRADARITAQIVLIRAHLRTLSKGLFAH